MLAFKNSVNKQMQIVHLYDRALQLRVKDASSTLNQLTIQQSHEQWFFESADAPRNPRE
jgi:hypothetical protein